MDPVLIAAILSLAGIVITTFGPSIVRIATAMINKTDPVAAVAAEDVGDILPATSHLDDAMAVAHAHDAALQLRTMRLNGTIGLAGLNAEQTTIVDHALTMHALVLAAAVSE